MRRILLMVDYGRHLFFFQLLDSLRIVKIIKFYAWELAIEERVRELRNKAMCSVSGRVLHLFGAEFGQELKLQLKYKLWNVVRTPL